MAGPSFLTTFIRLAWATLQGGWTLENVLKQASVSEEFRTGTP